MKRSKDDKGGPLLKWFKPVACASSSSLSNNGAENLSSVTCDASSDRENRIGTSTEPKTLSELHVEGEPANKLPQRSLDKTIPNPSVSISCFDVGDIYCDRAKIRKLSDSERFSYLKQHVHPFTGCTLLQQEIQEAKRKRVLKFQQSWLDSFTWLVYSFIAKGGFCINCVLFAENAVVNKRIMARKFVTESMQDLRHALEDLRKHEATQYHQDATVAASLFISTYLNPQNRIDNYLDMSKQKNYERNKAILRSIVECVVFCGKQGIALRGHRESDTQTKGNRGNFIALLQFRAMTDQVLSEHLKFCKKNAKYTSWKVQNEIIEIVEGYIKEKITEELREDKNSFFSIIADELTDEFANKEILTICLRFVDKTDKIKEVFFDFCDLERTRGLDIANAIKQSLEESDVDITRARGQAYDGAAAMSSENVGVQKLIREYAPLAFYTHCKSHALNLSIASIAKVQSVRNLMDTINTLYLFFHLSPKRQRFLEKAIEQSGSCSSKRKIPGLCKTRWAERHTCFDTLHQMYEYIVITLKAMTNPGEFYQDKGDNIDWNWDQETRIKAQGLLYTLTNFSTIVTFIITMNALNGCGIQGLASTLQKRDHDVFSAMHHIDTVKKEVADARSNIDEVYNLWYNDAVELAEKFGTEPSFPRLASLQKVRVNCPAEDAKTYFKRAVAIPLLDHLVAEMKNRFEKEQMSCFKLFILVPSVIKDKDLKNKDLIQDLYLWEQDMPSPHNLWNEVLRWKKVWCAIGESGEDIPSNLVEALPKADKDFFPNIRALLLIACALPITSCEAERSVSAFRRIKTYLRSRMTTERLTGLSLMNVHYDLDIDSSVITQRYEQKQQRRMFSSSILME